MGLTKKQQGYLSQLAHKTRPIVWVGKQGITVNVLNEINVALESHELVKIKLRLGDRDLRDKAIDDICQATNAEVVQRIGNIISLYHRNNETPVIKLPV